MADNMNPVVASGPARTVQGPKQFIADSYGDATDMYNVQAAQQMSATPSAVASAAQQTQQAPVQMPAPVGLFAPSQRPNEPITSGIDSGPGVSSAALGNAGYAAKLSDTLAKLLPYDTTGEIAALYNNALAKGI